MLSFGLECVLLVLLMNPIDPADSILVASAYTDLLRIRFFFPFLLFVVELHQGFPQFDCLIIFISLLVALNFDMFLVHFSKMLVNHLHFLLLFLLELFDVVDVFNIFLLDFFLDR